MLERTIPPGCSECVRCIKKWPTNDFYLVTAVIYVYSLYQYSSHYSLISFPKWNRDQKSTIKKITGKESYTYINVTKWAAELGFRNELLFYFPHGRIRSLGHIHSSKIPGPVLILGFPNRFTHHPRELVLSFRSPHGHHRQKDNIRQGNLTFDIQTQGWPPDLNPPAVGWRGGGSVSFHPHGDEGPG